MIYIHDENFTTIGTCEIYKSLIWRRRYCECGDFEVHIPISKATRFDWIKEENLVRKEEDFGVIQNIDVAINDAGEEMLVLKGRLIDIRLDLRIIWGTYNFNNKNIEDVIETLFTTQISNPQDTKRLIPNFIYKKVPLMSNKITKQVSYKNLLYEIEDICRENDIGFKVKYNFEDEKLYLELYKGIDRTIEQESNDHCIFSKEYENILTEEYVKNIEEYRNISLVAGEGEGSARKTTIVGDVNSSGLNRREMFTDAKDLSKENNTEQQYLELLKAKGIEELSQNSIIESFDSNINIKSNLKYKEDFDLGDKVTFVYDKINISVNKRIVEIEEIYEEDGLKVNCIFGEGKLTLLDKMKRGSI